MLVRLFEALAFVALLTALPAHAQDDRDRARAIAAEASEAYNLGQFEAALEGYQRAFEVFSAPQLLFNIGQCHRELGHHERVVFFFERYLEELPGAPNRAVVTELLEEARGAVAAQAAADEAERARAQRETESEAASREAEAAAAQRAAAEREAEASRLRIQEAEARRRAAESEPEIYERWWFWTVIGVAVVAVGLGVGLGVGLAQDAQLPMGTLGTWDLRP